MAVNWLEKYREKLVLLILFLLPWQTRWIFAVEPLQGGISEFGMLSFFVVEVLVVVAFLVQPFIKHHKWFDWTVILGWLMVLGALGSIFSASHTTTAIMAWIHVFITYLLFLNILNKHIAPQKMLYAFCLGLVLPSLLGIYQAVMGVSPASTILGMSAHDAAIPGTAVIETFSIRWLRAYGSFQHPNIFGGYLAVGLFAVFMLPRWYKANKHKLASYSMAVLFFVTLIISYSRSAWIAFAISFAITGWMLFTHHRVAMRKVVPLGLVLLVVGFFTVSLFVQPVTTRFDTTSRLEAQSVDERLEGLDQWKTVMFGHGFDRWANGVGIGNYTVALSEEFPDQEVYAYQPVHNLYLLILSEIGIVGAFFIILWAASIDRRNYSQIPRLPAVGALAMGNIILVVGFFDHYIWTLWPGLALFAFVMAMTCRLSEPDIGGEVS